MYEIKKESNHLVVEFMDNFDYPKIKTIIRHATLLTEYPHTNDIWLIGKHRANIRLSEVEKMVRKFQCFCPTDSTRTKTAIVVTEGLTAAVFELWVKALKKRVAFEIKTFRSLTEAEAWLGVAESKVA